MQGKIVSVDEFKAVGMTYFGDNNRRQVLLIFISQLNRHLSC
jgi:hypothetical protein